MITTNKVQFDRYGEEVSDSRMGMIFAYVLDPEKPKSSYYIVTHNGIPYDPLNSIVRRSTADGYKMKKVNRDTFDFYIMYLKTNNKVYYTKANREYINGKTN